MEYWCKVAANLDSHPKIRKAGRNGREVFLFALRRNADPSNKTPGVLAKEFLDPTYLADQLMVTLGDACDGLRHACDAGLLVETETGFQICGWDNDWSWRPKTGSERTQKWRESKAVTSCDDANVNTRQHVTDVTYKTETKTKTETETKSVGATQEHQGGITELKARVDAATTDIEQARRKRRAPETPLPEDWEPTAKHAALASERHVDCLLESRAFRAHAESHDRRCVRWDAAFTQWLLKSRPVNGTRAGPNANPTRVALDELARLEALERDA